MFVCLFQSPPPLLPPPVPAFKPTSNGNGDGDGDGNDNGNGNGNGASSSPFEAFDWVLEVEKTRTVPTRPPAAAAAAAAAAAQLPADYHGVSAAQEVQADLTIRHRSTSAKGSVLNDGKAGEDVIGGSATAGAESAGGSGKGVERSVTLFNSSSFSFFFLFPVLCV